MSENMMESTGAIVVAAGNSSRLGVDKIFMRLGGRPLLEWSLDTLQRYKTVDRIVVVLGKDNLEKGKKLASKFNKVTAVCLGGARRQDSVRNGLDKLGNCRWVIIQDGARPFLTETILKDGIAAAVETGAAVAAVPLKDTVKQAGKGLIVEKTLDRNKIWAVQTPQVFRFDIISKAHLGVKENVSDDAAMVEKMGYKVKLYQGSYDNIKITTREDVPLARIIARSMKCA